MRIRPMWIAIGWLASGAVLAQADAPPASSPPVKPADAPPTARPAGDHWLDLASLKPLLQRELRYPRSAIQGRKEGTVRVVVTYTADGRLLKTRLATSSEHFMLDDEALAVWKRIDAEGYRLRKPAQTHAHDDGSFSLLLPVTFKLSPATGG